MVNLFKNAVEAMEESGAIKVTAYMDKNKNVVIEVSDTGVGMTSEQMSLLGNPFYSTKAKGTGLGLMVTYRIIEALHGEIKVTSERAKGTTFTVTIPSAS
jgi:two-component system sporulation sensor kinase B